MPARKQFQSSLTASAALQKLLQESSGEDVPESVLQEQRVSFAFGNAPKSEFITKESVRRSSNNISLRGVE